MAVRLYKLTKTSLIQLCVQFQFSGCDLVVYFIWEHTCVLVSYSELSRRGYLDKVLGMALTLKQSSFKDKTLLTAGDEKKNVDVLKSIEDQQYVLTLDYTLKVHCIHVVVYVQLASMCSIQSLSE